MQRFVEEDLSGAEFRECDLTGARFVGVIMDRVDIDGSFDHLVVNGVDVSAYVDAELDRRHPVRVLIRSGRPDDLRAAWRELGAEWERTTSTARARGLEHESVDGEWSVLQTLRHLVFVHDSWFRRCCLGSAQLFTPWGIGPSAEPYHRAHGLDPSLEPGADAVVAVRDEQRTELTTWLADVTAEELEAPAPVPDGDVWPTYARGRTVGQCLRTVLTENLEHHRFVARDLALLAERS